MTTLSKRLDDYLAIRRSLGYDLTASEQVLRRFAAFADHQGEDCITVDLILRWKAVFGAATNDTWSARLRMVRIFATWLHGIDARTEVPPAGLISGKLRRARPHIYSDAEIARIVSGVAALPSRRLSGIRSFFKYVAMNEPQLLHHCQRVLAMPAKRHDKRMIDYLTLAEIEAVIAAPDQSTWHGRRDRTLLVLALQTGLRVSELLNLARADVVLGAGAHVRCMGKGRKERATPLRKDCVKVLREWLVECGGSQQDPLFVSNR